ncbi:MAG: HEAT repeat domain-containing protein, partial [Acidobacteria bacterium]|nr:HEAT repeat domain-containing protein [Acidobacteriota bacterium]
MTRLFPLFFTAALLLAAGPATPATGAPSAEVDELISQLPTRHWDAAVERLVEIGPPAVGALTAATREPGHVRGRACEALARIGTAPALDVVRAAAGSDDAGLRRGAVAALRFDGTEHGRIVLIGALGDPEPGVRAVAARSLGRVGSAAAVGPLTEALGDETEWVRVASAQALGQIGAAEAAPDLVERLADSRAVQRAARGALARMGDSAVPALAGAAEGPEPAVRWQAVWALGRIGGPAADEALVRFEEDEDWRVRNEIAAIRERRVVDEVALYPTTLEEQPEVASPSTRRDGTEVVVAVTGEGEGKWAVVPAGARDDERRERQRHVDAHDFPTLARTGLHCPEELARAVTITGRSLAEITNLGRPGGLSEDGFMAADEDVLSVLEGDNRLVAALGLTHPQLARPLFHVWNMVEADVEAGRWNHAEHRWDRIRQIVYNSCRVDVEAHDTKGGQESIFDDGLGGAYYMKIRRPPTAGEEDFLRKRY